MLQYGQQPNLIFVDLTLEGMSGLELIRWLRQNSIFDHVPVVVLTGSRTEEHRSTAIALRAKAYFIKPTKVEELDAIVQEALEHCREETF
jgi:DNA-binding response OmpR family regulator